jgi:hypothetical protein
MLSYPGYRPLAKRNYSVGSGEYAYTVQPSFVDEKKHFLLNFKRLDQECFKNMLLIPQLQTAYSSNMKWNVMINCVDKKNQVDVTFCILYFFSNSCSTCFGQPCAHYQELTTA